jgi:hypothetical protein
LTPHVSAGVVLANHTPGVIPSASGGPRPVRNSAVPAIVKPLDLCPCSRAIMDTVRHRQMRQG